MERKSRRIDVKTSEKGSTLVDNAMFIRKETSQKVRKEDGKPFTANDYILQSEDGTRLYINAYADLNRAFEEQEVKEGDVVSITFQGKGKSKPNKFGKVHEKNLLI